MNRLRSIRRLGLATCVALLQTLHAELPSGYVIGWGNNGNGQATGVPSLQHTDGKVLATGTLYSTGTVSAAGQVLSNAVGIAAGYGHSLALLSDGTVAGWGGNYRGSELGFENPYLNGTNGLVRVGGQVLDSAEAVAASTGLSFFFGLALNTNSTVVTWGNSHVPAGITNIAAVATEQRIIWVLKRDGTIMGWTIDPSLPAHGILFPVNGISNAVAIAVGPGGYFTHGIALLRDGTVANWGRKFEDRNADPPEGLSNVVAVAAGAGQSLALRQDGTVVGWGWNQSGEATGITTTGKPNLANFSSGTVHVDDEMLTNVVSIAAGHSYSMALKKDGTVVAWGKMGDSNLPATVPEGLSNVVAIAAGAEDFCLAITTNKAVADRFARDITQSSSDHAK